MHSKKDRIMALLSLHKGRARAITVAEIAARIGEEDSGLTNPVTRKMIKELINEGELIGSCGKGYFMIQNELELQVYIKSLNDRKMGIQDRINKLYVAWARRNAA